MQEDLAEARDELARTPMTLTEAAYVDVEYEVETHRLQVTRPVTVEVRFGSGGAAITRNESIQVERTDQAHAANARLRLAADRVDLPSPKALNGDLDQATARWLAGVIDEVHAAYRQRLLAAARDRADGLALHVLLAPSQVDDRLDDELAQAIGVPEAAHLVAMLDADRATDAYARRDTAAAPDSIAPSAAVPDAGRQPSPTERRDEPLRAVTTGHRPTSGVGAPVRDRPTAPTGVIDPDATMRARGGYPLKIVPLSFASGKNQSVRVDRDGKLYSRGRLIGSWSADGTFSDGHRIVLAIDRRGVIWFAQRQPVEAGKLVATEVSFATGATLSVDPAGHVVTANRGRKLTSIEVITPRSAAALPVATLSAYLAMGALRLR